jgi:hypothetical protein
LIKNTAGQKIGAQMVSATDGSAFTGAVTVYVTIDAGTQAAGSVGSGACTHEGNGFHTYAPAQAETNGDHVAFTFTGTGAVPQTVQVYTGVNVTHFGGTAGSFTGGKPDVQNVAGSATYTRTGTAQAGSGTTITLDAGASAVNDYYTNQLIWIASGTGAGQARFITDYVGATKVATVATWATNPDNTSVFYIQPFDALAGATVPTAAVIADAVWEEPIADHTGTAGSTAEALDDASGAGASAADIADAVLDEALAGHTTAGTLGKAISDTVTAVDTEVAAIKARTDNLPSDPADASDVAAAISAAQTAILAKLPAALSSNGNLKADIREVNNTPLTGDGSSGSPWGPA